MKVKEKMLKLSYNTVIKKIILFTIVVFSLVFIYPIYVDATIITPSQSSQFSYYDYVIDNYDVDIIVNENNTLDITETITAYFNVSKHGIFRTIPLKNTVTRLDGTTSKNRTQVTNLSVNNEYTKTKENGNLKIQIGSENHTFTGKQTYVIKYTYNLGKDPMKDYDELYFNIIGNEWDTVIGNVTFTIMMPKEFDASKLGFSSGITGSTKNNHIKYTISENKITGNYEGILNPNEALTVRCELPEGYFVKAGLTVNPIDYLVFILPVLFLIIAIFLWYKFGRDDQVIETVEFYPPEGLNSLEVGFLYKGKAINQDVTSLLIYLANKGYIQISDKKIDLNADKLNLSEDAKKNADQKIMELQNKLNEERKLNPNSDKIKYYENLLNVYKDIDKPINYEQYGLTSSIQKANKEATFTIKKLKDYDGNNLNEKWFMEGLFEFEKTEVTDKDLYNRFYITNNRILSNINSKQNKDKISDKKTSTKSKFILLMIAITYFLITIPLILAYNNDFISSLITIFGSCFAFKLALNEMIYGNGKVTYTPVSIYLLAFGLIFWIALLFPILKQDSFYLLEFIFGLICIVGMALCWTYLPKRTPYGNEMLGKLRGFKNFLETVEKDKLEAMVMKDPTYFYNILPYTYVLGVSDKWIKKFETISIQEPSWYDNSSSFNVTVFGNFISSTMNSAQNVMSSSPSSDSGSSSDSGGGSSGGGSGGGGGGSW